MLAHGWSEPAPSLRRIHEQVAFPIPEDERIEMPTHHRIAPDHEILRWVDSHLPPSARALAGLNSRARADTRYATLCRERSRRRRGFDHQPLGQCISVIGILPLWSRR